MHGLSLDNNVTVLFHGGQLELDDYNGGLENQTLRVVTLAEEPFIMLKNPKDPLDVQDDEIEGFCADLFRKLAEETKFSYSIYVVPDGAFGIKDPTTRKWNGLVRELVERVSVINHDHKGCWTG